VFLFVVLHSTPNFKKLLTWRFRNILTYSGGSSVLLYLSDIMGRNNHFQFKQFRIVQEKAAMKVGIDGVLLGAWADLGDERRVLDVGAGTGLLSLMAAQRTNAVVDAVELEPEAAEEAAFNFSESPWAERLHVYTTAFQQYVTTEKYDHLISRS